MRLVTEHQSGTRLGDFLQNGLNSDATSFRGAVAFVRASGMAHLAPLISNFSATRPFELIVGVDLKGTTVEGLTLLKDSLQQHGRAFVFHNNGSSTFHPKLFSFSYPDRTELYVGSGNFTAGGLFTNHEAGLHLSLGATVHETDLLKQVHDSLDRWSINGGPSARLLDQGLIDDLAIRALIVTEAQARAAAAGNQGSSSSGASTATQGSPLFGAVSVPPAPAPLAFVPGTAAASAPATNNVTNPVPQAPPPVPTAPSAGRRFFVMTLQNTDVGSGQVTANTARRSPEIFIPLSARDADPAFWGWPQSFTPDALRPGKMDRPGVPFLVNGRPTDVHIWYNPTKRDVRLRSEILRSAGQIDDILQIERRSGSDAVYIARVIPQADPQYPALLARCNQPVRNSLKRFGYF